MTNNPSREYLFWYAKQLEQFIFEQGHTSEELLAYVTNQLTNKETQQ